MRSVCVRQGCRSVRGVFALITVVVIVRLAAFDPNVPGKVLDA
jgi:hypothetical protein